MKTTAADLIAEAEKSFKEHPSWYLGNKQMRTSDILLIFAKNKIRANSKYFNDLEERGYNVLAELGDYLRVSSDGTKKVDQNAVAEFLCGRLNPDIKDGELFITIAGEEINDGTDHPVLKTAIANFVHPTKRNGTTEKSIEQLFMNMVFPSDDIDELEIISARDLLKKELPEVFCPVEGLIPEGLTYIAAPPKTGKSWLMLDMCRSVAEGKPFLGMKTNRCDALYLALESGDKFEQERLKKTRSGEEEPEGFYYLFKGIRSLPDGFLKQLDGIVAKHPAIKLIVIDTKRFVEYPQVRGGNAYQADYKTGSALKTWADEHGVAIVAVTHTNKMQHPDDVFYNMNGTTAAMGSTDATIVIAKEKRNSKDAILAVTGRRIKSMERNIRFDDETCKWIDCGEIIGDSSDREEKKRFAEYLESNIRKGILKLCDKNAEGWRGRCGALIEAAAKVGVGITETSYQVGKFINENIGYFMDHDRVMVTTYTHGQAAKEYGFKLWHNASEGIETIE